MSDNKSVFDVLSAIDVKQKTKRKGKLDYLPWADAWKFLMRAYPNAQRTIYRNPENHMNYFTDGSSGWVTVGITIDGVEHVEDLAIMDFRNAAVKLDKITSVEVSKSIQRCSVKATARHGLGLDLWAAEDEVEPTTSAPVAPQKSTKIALVKGDNSYWNKASSYVKSHPNSDMDTVIKTLATKYSISPKAEEALRELAK